MVRNKPNWIAKGLLAVFALQLVFPLLLVLAISLVQFTQKEVLEQGTGQLQTIVLTESEFQQANIHEEGEMLYQQALYDVHSITKQDGKYIVRALADERETALQKSNNSELNKETKPGSNSLKAFVFPLVFFEENESETAFLFSHKAVRYAPLALHKCSNPSFNTLSPPPDTRL